MARDPMAMQQFSILNRNLSMMGRLESVAALVATVSQLVGEKLSVPGTGMWNVRARGSLSLLEAVFAQRACGLSWIFSKPRPDAPLRLA